MHPGYDEEAHRRSGRRRRRGVGSGSCRARANNNHIVRLAEVGFVASLAIQAQVQRMRVDGLCMLMRRTVSRTSMSRTPGGGTFSTF
jgi:hypothetical protein